MDLFDSIMLKRMYCSRLNPSYINLWNIDDVQSQVVLKLSDTVLSFCCSAIQDTLCHNVNFVR